MATVIDALMVTLGLDPAGLKKGADEAVKAQAKVTAGAVGSAKAIDEVEKKLTTAQIARTKELDAQAKHIADGFKKIRNEALGLLAIFTAGMGLTSFAENAITTTASLSRMSGDLNMSAKDLAEWQLAAKHAGGTAEGMTSQLKQASDDLASMKMGLGQSASIQASMRYGATLPDLKDANSLLLKQADILKRLYDQDPTRAAAAAKLMGVNEGSYQLMKQGSAAVIEARKAQSALAEEQERLAAKAEALRKKLDDLSNKFNEIAVRVLTEFMPAIDMAADSLRQIGQWVSEHKEDISIWIQTAVKAVIDFAKSLDKASESVGGWKNVLIGLLGLKVLSFAANLLTLAVALTRVGTALGGLSTFATLLKGVGALALLFHSDDLNANEAGDLAKHRSGMPGFDADGKPTGAMQAPAAGGKLSRGMRNNNPGNIEYGNFAKKHGATGSDGRFAIFPTMEAGQAAMQELLRSNYLDAGKDTISKVISKYAPPKENNTAAYIASVAKQTGIGPDQKLSEANLPALAAAISRHENGAAWDQRNAAAVANLSAGIGAGSRADGGGKGSSTVTNEIHVGEVNVKTSATNADGIARDAASAIKNRFGYVLQANTGML